MRPNVIAILGIAAFAAVGGTAAYHVGALHSILRQTPPPVAPPVIPDPAPATDAGVVPLKSRSHSVSLPFYVMKQTSTDPVLVQQTATLRTESSVSIWRQAHTALSALTRFPREEGSLQNPLPPGAKVLGVHVDRNGIATVDLSPQFVDNFNGGAREEQVTIYAIVNTVGAVKGINGVRFSVAGRGLDEFAGHLDLSSPLTPDASLVEPAQ